MRNLWQLALVATMLAVSPPAGAATYTFDFDSAGDAIAHGDVIAEQYLAEGLRIHAENPNRAHDLAMAFDSDLSNTLDPDLEYAWDGGNLSGVPLGNMLIVTQDANAPNDEGSRPAGSLIFEFLADDMRSIGFDLVDVEDAVAEAGSIDLYHEGDLQASFSFANFTDPLSELYDGTIAFGDNHANRIEAIDLGPLGLRFDEAVFRLGGSGAIDNVVVDTAPIQPLTEPAGLVLLALALAGRALRRR